MKKILALALSLASFLMLSYQASAQSPACELYISGTTVSNVFEGTQVVADCSNNNAFAKFQFMQFNNTNLPHYYNNVPGHYTYYAEICDQFGNCVVIGDISSGYPTSAVFPTGDKAIWHYYGCNHPSVIEINH